MGRALRGKDNELRVASYERYTSYEFKSMSHEFKSTSYDFKSTNYEFESMSYEFISTSDKDKFQIHEL